ncbi:MAG: response regulator transcription factor [Pseudomonas sp.]|uniref:response regulator transcription factor n=1 Tax=Pseudomonas abieticivorans TaxID=2931382 RepID=UPI0020BFDB6A|nr:response regulator transcription factor [Pseudomonas sp. PIA16]MDE1167265.1 response regulator transcription factor [Pseudomonas sp.]
MQILLVEDNRDILANVTEYLQSRGCQVTGAEDGLTGLHLAATRAFDMVILDVMLPGINGTQVCQRLRESSRADTPVIMLTARDALSDRLEGFRSGADDYLVKPFALAELMARIEALVWRLKRRNSRVLSIHDLAYDLDTLHVSRQGTSLRLTPTSLKMLELLMRRSPAVVTRRELEQAVWGDYPPNSDSLRTNLYLLRQAVDKPFEVPLIQTVFGIGYQLVYKGGEAA